MNIRYIIFSCLFILLCSFTSLAQQKVFVATKTITKEYNLTNRRLAIQGEKADISLVNSSENKVQVEIKLIAKNYSKETAKNDLSIIKYQISDEPDQLLVKNYFESDIRIHSTVSSNLSVKYLIHVPENTTIQIQNIYGDISLYETKLNGSIRNSFGLVTTENETGIISFNIDYSELRMTNTVGDYNISSKNSQLVLNDISGNYILKPIYGDVTINSLKNINELKINGQRTKVDIVLPNIDKYSLILKAKKEKIIVPTPLTDKIVKDSGYSSLKIIKSKDKPILNIETSYCPITIK